MTCACCALAVNPQAWDEVWEGLCRRCAAADMRQCVACDEWESGDRLENCDKCLSDFCRECRPVHNCAQPASRRRTG